MKTGTIYILMALLLHGFYVQSQSNILFQSQDPLPLKLNYSKKKVINKTNDSTYIKSQLQYKLTANWKKIEIHLRVRGHFRKSYCDNAPLKIKISKNKAKGTLFEGNKNLKLVLPCQTTPLDKDYVLKEYIAYKMYGLFSPYHFKTRKVVFNSKTKPFDGFLIEDDKTVAKRFQAKISDQKIVHSHLEARATTVHSFFQFLIGNTDFFYAPKHNIKFIEWEDNIQILPYDFDLSGFVNPNYGAKNKALGIENLTKRQYKGIKRDPRVMEEVRQLYLAKEEEIFTLLEKEKKFFTNQKEYEWARAYIDSFYALIKEDSQFQSEIVQAAR